MIITFLGTGTSQGVPIIGDTHPVCLSADPKDKRLRSSVMIQEGDCYLVIDCGPDFRQQMLNVHLPHLSAILFTHEHSDHTAGLDDTRPYCYRQGEIPIYAQEKVLEQLKRRFTYIFKEKNRYPGAPKLIPIVVKDNAFEIDNLLITPIIVRHGELAILGYRIGLFAYLTDVKEVVDSEIKKLENLDILVVNALRIEAHPTHFNLEEAIGFAQRVNAKRTYFTHISHLLGFYHQVNANLPEGIALAYDGLVLEIYNK